MTAIGDTAALAAADALSKLGESPDLYAETIARYGRAVGDAQTVREAWELEGRPVYALGSRGQLTAHPLIKELRDAEAHAHEIAKILGLVPMAKRGRPAGTSQSPDRQSRKLKAA